MKFLHIADLHLGRRVGEFSMIEDQRYILREILRIADESRPDGILVAGDVYDKSLPAADAVELLDDFLTALASRKLPVYMVSGNHDSPERLNFGSRILAGNGVHIAGIFTGSLQKTAFEDEFGKVNLFLLPYIKPAVIRPYFQRNIENYDDAVRAVIGGAEIDTRERNVLVAHQFVTSGGMRPERSDSESIAVGGLDNVDASAFEPFDYVALGHLHGPQRIGRDTVRYAGSPLKYSFSETRQHKSVTVVQLREKGCVQFETVPLRPLRDMREIKGPIDALLSAGMQDSEGSRDYIHATLTDRGGVYDAVGKLRRVYPNLMRLDFENSRAAETAPSDTAASGDVARKSPMELFSEFYVTRNQSGLTLEQRRIMKEVFEQAGENR